MSAPSRAPAPRTLAIGDVHGCDTALATLLDFVAPTADDTVVFLGDLVDRGPGTKQVIEMVLDLESQCRVIVIQGNHEEMLLNALNGLGWKMWIRFGGQMVLDSYGEQRAIPLSHLQLMEQALDYWETPTDIFIHANLEPDVPLSEQSGEMLRWLHLTGFETRYDPDRRVICGHTPQKSGVPLVFDGWVAIDTDCQRGGWLTCLDVEADLVYQANEQGETRTFGLDAWVS
jgi:serine/threonine protein phosphatase 1